ncbi:hypothetical protein ACIPMW_00110 [Streptomyces sp. NPDC086669]|uniref:hypothetical protein n=1 Tax=Streptomyces sp. NPDC086669 TaxID=3365753 RepID=UPI00381267F2
MSIEIRLVGGPADGRTYAIPDATPPLLYFIPLAPSMAELLSNSLESSPIQKAEYEPQFENSLYCVADDGAYLYRHRTAPLTPDQRAALADERREARAAEERRAAEMDENWRKVREERPDYPEDWRDLF